MKIMKILQSVTWMSLLFLGLARAEIAVVGNPALGVDTLSKSQVKMLFLGKTSRLPDGSPVTVVDQDEGSATREAFGKQVLRKNVSQMKAYWSRMIFSGKATPPRTVADDAAVRDWVARTANGIGYLDASQVDDSVKILLKVP